MSFGPPDFGKSEVTFDVAQMAEFPGKKTLCAPLPGSAVYQM